VGMLLKEVIATELFHFIHVTGYSTLKSLK
jgi:hypothetical protein